MFRKCVRRMGVELEYNSFDRLSRSYSDNNLPNGIYAFGDMVVKAIQKNVDINKWQQTNNNLNWIVKPDSSCGLEVCSPPNQPQVALPAIAKVITALTSNKSVTADRRCSLHVHIEIEDFTENDICFLVQSWINYEHLFYFLTKEDRWYNRYCKPLGYHYAFSDKVKLNSNRCLQILSDNKYFAINFYHYKKEKRKTVEFRIMGGDACVDIDDCINWCKLILIFVERCKSESYDKNFIDTIEYKNISTFYEFINYQGVCLDDCETIMWMISRLNDTICREEKLPASWPEILMFCKEDIKSLIEKLQESIK